MSRKKFVSIIMLLIILAPIGLSGYLYYKLHSIKSTPTGKLGSEVKDLVGKVSNLYLLPSDEEPTIATVSDPKILKGQSFFEKAFKGDKVLIFHKAGKAVLYRPSIGKIIEIAPIKNNPLSPNYKNEVSTEEEIEF